MIYILLSIVSMALGFFLGKIKFKKKETIVALRKGLITLSITMASDKFEVTGEVIEIDNDGNGNSKLKCVEFHSNHTLAEYGSNKDRIKKLIEGWRREKDVIWYNNKNLNRDQKITEILK